MYASIRVIKKGQNMEKIYDAYGNELDPEAWRECERCTGEFQIKEMYNGGRLCDNCYHD